MSSIALSDSYRKVSGMLKVKLLLIAVAMFALVNITGCGSSSMSVDLPKEFIQDFIAKHETMADKSLVYYYVKEEQNEVAEKIDVACRINKTKGKLASLENATFDFTELQIELVDQKEEYVDDEPVVFVKVAVKGSYKMKLPGVTEKIEADDTIVLQMARNEWKVNKSHNPWS